MNKCKNLPVFYKFYDFDTCIPKFWMSVNFLRTTHLKNAYSHEQRMYSRAHPSSWLNVSSPITKSYNKNKRLNAGSNLAVAWCWIWLFSLTPLVVEQASVARSTTNLQCTSSVHAQCAQSSVHHSSAVHRAKISLMTLCIRFLLVTFAESDAANVLFGKLWSFFWIL